MSNYVIYLIIQPEKISKALNIDATGTTTVHSNNFLVV